MAAVNINKKIRNINLVDLSSNTKFNTSELLEENKIKN